MLKRLLCLTILSALLLTLAGCIIEPPPPPPNKIKYSIIEGYITDINGPVTDVKITITEINSSRTSPMLEPRFTYSTTTDSKGYFKADYMAAETFTIKAEKTGYNTVTVTDIVTVEDRTTAKNITLTKTAIPPK